MADRIAHGRWRRILRMRAVHAHVADMHVLIVEDADIAARGRQHYEAELHRQSERRRHRPALILRVRKSLAGDGEIALLLHHSGGPGRQDRIAIVADEPPGIGLAVRQSAQIPQRLRPRWHSLEIERVLAPANLHDSRRAVGGVRRQSEHHRRKDADEQSLTWHRVPPWLAVWRNESVSLPQWRSLHLRVALDKTP